MGAKNTGDITDQGHILSTELSANGVIVAQTGDVISNTVAESNVEVWTPIGYAARPSNPDPGKAAAECLMLTGGDRNKMIAAREMRCAEIYGNLAPGEVCIFASGEDVKGQGKISLKADGNTFIHTTEDNTHEALGRYLKFGPDEFRVQFPWGSVVFDKTGFHVVHDSGASIHLGGQSVPTQPNYVRINTSYFHVDSPMSMLGPSSVNGGKGVFLAPVVAPVASIEPGTPTPIGAGMGVIVGVTAGSAFFGI